MPACPADLAWLALRMRWIHGTPSLVRCPAPDRRGQARTATAIIERGRHKGRAYWPLNSEHGVASRLGSRAAPGVINRQYLSINGCANPHHSALHANSACLRARRHSRPSRPQRGDDVALACLSPGNRAACPPGRETRWRDPPNASDRSRTGRPALPSLCSGRPGCPSSTPSDGRPRPIGAHPEHGRIHPPQRSPQVALRSPCSPWPLSLCWRPRQRAGGYLIVSVLTVAPFSSRYLTWI